ncbi:hypothetical protein TIFTF001_031674 [Ficus carica]|uniref:Retrotransposon gag domain-containing protein n=1 Tax=Ficus carica TaxID=3494 RepID=A0AA88J1A6_FICCA|nr:hypothetical protein TIFTF001_031674 [Ficus carica]
MGRPRKQVNQNPQEPDLANVIPRANEVSLQDNPAPPVAPQAPGVRQGIPRNLEVPLAPVGIQANPPLVREDLLFERFRRMKAPEFEGLTDPIEADNWLIDIQDARHWWMTVQMRRDVAAMSWQDFVAEFRMMYYSSEILAAQQDEFTSMKQGSMTVLEAVKKFEQLARLCPELIPNETEKVRRTMKMFRTDIAKQDKEARAQIFKAKKEEKAVVKQLQPRQNQELYPKGQNNNSGQNSKQFGKNKRKGNATGQGQQMNYPQKKNNRENKGNSNDYPVPLCEKLHLEQTEPEPAVPE